MDLFICKKAGRRLYQHLTFCIISIEAMCQNKNKKRQKEVGMTGRFFGWAFEGK